MPDISPKPPPSLRIPLRVLAAINKFATTESDRFHLYGVHVSETELMATDGMRLVRVPLEHPSISDYCPQKSGYPHNFLIPVSYTHLTLPTTERV